MKAVILAGGLGTRLAEETVVRPKPMIEIGGKPILWHIMKIYSRHGIDDFVVCCGYKGFVIKEYFANYFLHSSDVTFDLAENRMEVHRRNAEPWRVTLVDTGEETQTGGRLRRVASYLEPDQSFCFTYGDGLSDVDIRDLVARHSRSGKQATITAVQPQGRFGALEIKGDLVDQFVEKPLGDRAWINGGFFVLEPAVLARIDGDGSVFERDVLPQLARDGELHSVQHSGFWWAMDTLRDRRHLEELWATGDPPWLRETHERTRAAKA
jgi:glucose-1-phosphate cytidylyltransferase